jgi:hypothetical protein
MRTFATVDGYKPPRIGDMPKVEVNIVSSMGRRDHWNKRDFCRNGQAFPCASMGFFFSEVRRAYFRSDRIVLI